MAKCNCKELTSPLARLPQNWGPGGLCNCRGAAQRDGCSSMQNRTNNRIRGNSRCTVEAARANRRALTPAESRLWEAIRMRQVGGMRFRCQHPLGQFVLDFCCPSHRLVLEVDGSSHDGEEEQDASRTAHLEAYGYLVLRFTNAAVCDNLEAVINTIVDAAATRTPRRGTSGQRTPRKAHDPAGLTPPELGGGGPSPSNLGAGAPT